MNSVEIIGKLQKIFREFFEDDAIVLTADTASGDVGGWDSVSHIQLIFEVEEEFGVQFDADEIPRLMNIGALAAAIERMSGQ